MKVRELIKKLQKFDPNASVEVYIGEIQNEPIKCIEETIYNTNTTNGVMIVPTRIKETYLKRT